MITAVAWQALLQMIRGFDRLAVAFSGGADSTLLLYAALQVLAPGHVLALSATTVMHTGTESASAAALAAQLGAPHRVLEADTLSIPDVAGNTRQRCYACKRTLFEAMWRDARDHGFTVLADGTNADDETVYRPGLKALRELGVVSPLREAGLSKQDVYTLSEQLGLPTARKPATPCLATRVPYDTPLSEPVLRRIEAAEEEVHRRGFPVCRVRHHQDLARLEVPVRDIPALLAEKGLPQALRALGYRHVAIDMEGFRSGSFDEDIGETT